MKKSFITLLFIALNCSSFANIGVWNEVNKNLTVEGEQKLHPNKYRLFELNDGYIKDFLFKLPVSPDKAQVIALPTPEGKMMNFRIWQTPAMAEELAAKYPMIKNFTAVSIDNPAITAKVNYTYLGFNAMVYDGHNTYFIDPYTNRNTGFYFCFYKRDHPRNANRTTTCNTVQAKEDIGGERIIIGGEEPPTINFKVNGATRRIYRFALTCTGEYAVAVDGPNPTKANVISAMTTTLTRCNGILEKDMGSTLQLVANNDQLVYLDETTDPFTDNQNDFINFNTLAANQTNTDNVIGDFNYDIGHIFCTGNGGIADTNSLCDPGYKARGATGRPNPIGDPFDVDYVIHEIGHQYGAPHTFNSGVSTCGNQYSVHSAYEPGSGSTIMAYAGLCGIDNIQNNSNDYYHAQSIDQVTTYYTFPNMLLCGNRPSSGNTPPVVPDINATYPIPYLTPFELMAPEAQDSDHDVLTYCWEQYDLGDIGKTFNTTQFGPIFRSFPPTTERLRVFPVMDSIRNNVTNYLGEKVPSVGRTLSFRLTVRDVLNGYGTVNLSDNRVNLNVTDQAGPFTVLGPNTGNEHWETGKSYTVTWDVSNTDLAPVNCSHVDIYLSEDDGRTYPITLISNTPNDGSEQITVPTNVNTSTARVKVKGHNNVFFDISNKPFPVRPWPQSVANVSFEEDVNIYPVPATEQLHVDINNKEKYQLQLTNSIGQIMWQGEMSQKTTINIARLAAGVYQLSMVQISGGEKLVKRVVIQ